MSKYLIAVDSGHGMETGGKRTPALTKQIGTKKVGSCIHEKEFNKPTSEYLIAALKRCGFDTINVSPGTNDVSLANRVKAANNAKADLFISKHYNAIGSNWQTKAKGIVSIYNLGSTKGKKAAELIQKRLIETHGGYSYGARADKDISGCSLYVLKNTKMPAVLTESGFMDYEIEANRMIDVNFQKSDAEATCKGICDYFGVKYVEESIKPSTENKPNDTKVVYRVIAGSYSSKEAAEKQVAELKKKGIESFVAPYNM